MIFTIKLCTYAKLFENELFICIKIDLVLNNRQSLIGHKTQTNKQTNKHTSVSYQAKIYIHQFSTDTGCRLDGLSKVIADRYRERERERG